MRPTRDHRRSYTVAALAVFAAGVLATPAGASAFTPGAAGAGDPFFPRAGNGGYEVSRYLINLRFRPDRDRLVARTTIRAVATHDLSAFNLDFAGPRVRRVEVDGDKARFDETRRELVITPAAGIPAGASFRVEVAYAGRPRTIRDPDGTREGWFETDDGGYALGEPIGSLAWYPSNNIPTDKAKFEVTATVPRGLKAISNGALVDVRKRKRWTTFTWRTSERMATYLAMIAIGRFSLDRKPVSGIDSVVAIDPRHLKEGARSLRVSAKIISFFRKLFGPYPFSETGAIIEKTPPTIDYALETQTRPFYPSPPDPVTIAHELAHEWYGNSVTPTRWPDIWLNEGFATWAEWRWLQRTGGPSTSKRLAEVLALPASSAFWDVAPANPGSAANLFHPAVYQRGAAALEVLRQRIGDVDFQAILREWAQGRRHGHGTTLEFIALAEARSGEELDPLFDEWLFQADKPAS